MIEAPEQRPWKKLPPQDAWPNSPREVVEKQDAGLAVSVEVFFDGPVVADVLDRPVKFANITRQETFKRFVDKFGQLLAIWMG